MQILTCDSPAPARGHVNGYMPAFLGETTGFCTGGSDYAGHDQGQEKQGKSKKQHIRSHMTKS